MGITVVIKAIGIKGKVIQATVILGAIAGIVTSSAAIARGVPQAFTQGGDILELPGTPKVAPPPPAAIVQELRLEISRSQRRLTVFQGQQPVKSYPVAVGKPGWETPLGKFQILQMFRNPAWKNPFTGVVIPGGDPGNPLGRHWIGFWTDGKNWVGMHGTPNPGSVGRAASHGCVRMLNKDIEDLFLKVAPGTIVTVVR